MLRRVEMKRRKPANKRRDAATTAAALEWHNKVVAFGCRVCPQIGEECEGVVQAHHIVRRQFVQDRIDTRVRAESLNAVQRAELERLLLWDLRNGMGVCYRAHRRHHSRVQPIPARFVSAAAYAFAQELELVYRIEMEYAS